MQSEGYDKAGKKRIQEPEFRSQNPGARIQEPEERFAFGSARLNLPERSDVPFFWLLDSDFQSSGF